MLSALAPESLARLRFPLGELRKPQVRELAERAGLAVARKRDSQDLCFLAGTRHGEFLERHGGLGERPGPIVDRDGAVLGEHAGAHVYTVGQRHGLGVAAPEPLYVLATDTRANTVTVGPRGALLADAADGRGRDAPPRRRLRGRRARARPRAPVRVPRARRARAPDATRAWRSSWRSRPSAPPPGRSRACTRAMWSSATAPSLTVPPLKLRRPMPAAA